VLRRALELARRTRGQARTQAERGGVGRALDGRPVLGGSRRGAIVGYEATSCTNAIARAAPGGTRGPWQALSVNDDRGAPPPPLPAQSPQPPPPLPPPALPPKRRRRPLVAAATVAGVIVVLAIAAGTLIRLPYVLIAPGSAQSVERVVKIDGAQTFPHRGRLLLLTVSVSADRPNLFTFLSGYFDENTDVVPEDQLLQGKTRAEDQRLNKLEMADSQMTAKRVALERLGYTVPVSGTGAAVVAVQKGSPADGKLRVGDVITAVDGQPVTLSEELGQAVRSRPPGEPVTFAVDRDGKSTEVTVTTRAATGGACPGRAQVGVVTRTRNEKFDFPVDVKIDTGKISGPSAGLAFTLTIIDDLTPGDLTGGKNVAVTGTIQPGGTVGPIGGVQQKAVTAERAGAKLFLVPMPELKDARSRAGGMKVVGIRTLDDALTELSKAGGEPSVPPAPSSPQC
jgi:PDZ domain-containing protein